MDRNLNYDDIQKKIKESVSEYLWKYDINALVIGVSGGLDSGVNCALLKEICAEKGIPLIGRYIHIETNSKEEKERAEAIGKAFCTDFMSIDLTELYYQSLVYVEELRDCNPKDIATKIRRGNIKARLRMVHLYDLAQYYKGIVVDNDNMTEYLLGFYTLNGDVGDITPLADLYKTEVFKLARHLASSVLSNVEEIQALQAVVDATPTDGLGITSSDVEQFGANSYDEVDDILMSLCPILKILNETKTEAADIEFSKVYNQLNKKYKDVFRKVWGRHIKSNFKRKHPYKVRVFDVE